MGGPAIFRTLSFGAELEDLCNVIGLFQLFIEDKTQSESLWTSLALDGMYRTLRVDCENQLALIVDVQISSIATRSLTS